jgi:hypothetical protein
VAHPLTGKEKERIFSMIRSSKIVISGDTQSSDGIAKFKAIFVFKNTETHMDHGSGNT